MANLAPHCVILDVSSEVAGCPSSNVLDSDPSKIWLTEAGLPQWISLTMGEVQRKSEDNVIKTIGWQCWHPYSTNPKTVSLHVSRDGTRFRLWDTFDGPQKRGVHLFQISPIAIRIYPYISLEISETHGGESTYMNRLFLYQDEIVGSSPSHGTSLPKLAPLGTPAPPPPPLNFTNEEDEISPTSGRSSDSDDEENDQAALAIVNRLESALGIRGAQSPDSVMFDDRSSEEEEGREEHRRINGTSDQQVQAGAPITSVGVLLDLESRLANLERAVLLTVATPAPASAPAPALKTQEDEGVARATPSKPPLPPPAPTGGLAHPYEGAQVAVRRKSATMLSPLPSTAQQQQESGGDEKKQEEEKRQEDRQEDRDREETGRRLQDLEALNRQLLVAVGTLSLKLTSSPSAPSEADVSPAEEKGQEEEEEDEEEEETEAEEEEEEEEDVKVVVEQAVRSAVASFMTQSTQVLQRVESTQNAFIEGFASLAAESATEGLGPESEEDAQPPLDLAALRKSCGLGPGLVDAARDKLETNSAFDSTFSSRRREHGSGRGKGKRRLRRQQGASSPPSPSDTEAADQVEVLAKALKAAHIKKRIKEEHLRKLNHYASLSMHEKELRYFGKPMETTDLHWRY